MSLRPSHDNLNGETLEEFGPEMTQALAPKQFVHRLTEKDMEAIAKHGEEQTKKLIAQLMNGKWFIFTDDYQPLR